jgi:hypothetical protein
MNRRPCRRFFLVRCFRLAYRIQTAQPKGPPVTGDAFAGDLKVELFDRLGAAIGRTAAMRTNPS